MKCEQVVRDLPLLLYGELSFEEENAVEQHLAECESCQLELAKVHALHEAIDDAEPQVPAALLADCRRRLRVSVSALSGTVPVRPKGLLGAVQDVLTASWTAWLKPAGAVALVAIGFLGARLIPDRETARVETPIPVVNREELAPPPPMASHVRFVEPDRDGRVRIILEETRQRVLSGSPVDDNIRRLLLTAARESNDPGLRVDSVDLLRSESESADVRDLLLYALEHDRNPGVRLKALEGLREHADAPETRKALARVLLTDDNPGVRTQAIDMLTEQREEPDVADALEKAMRHDANEYVRLKCRNALHEISSTGSYQ